MMHEKKQEKNLQTNRKLNLFATSVLLASQNLYTYNPGQNMWQKVKKASKIGQDFKNLFNFACFLRAIAKV